MTLKRILAAVATAVLTALCLTTGTASADVSSTTTPDNAHPHCWIWVKYTADINQTLPPYTATQACFATVADLNANMDSHGFIKLATGWDRDATPDRTLDWVTAQTSGCALWTTRYFYVTNYGSGGFNDKLDQFEAPNGSPYCQGFIIWQDANFGDPFEPFTGTGIEDFGSNSNWASSQIIGTNYPY